MQAEEADEFYLLTVIYHLVLWEGRYFKDGSCMNTSLRQGLQARRSWTV